MRKRLYQSTKSYILKFSLIYWKQEEEEKKNYRKVSQETEKKNEKHKIQCKKWDRKMVTITTHSIMYPNGSNLFIDEVIFFGVLIGENKNGDIILFCLVHYMFDKHLN